MDGMTKKTLENIKYGSKVINLMPEGDLFFVEDIRRATGLDDKTLKNVLSRLLKNGHLYKNERGQWFRIAA